MAVICFILGFCFNTGKLSTLAEQLDKNSKSFAALVFSLDWKSICSLFTPFFAVVDVVVVVVFVAGVENGNKQQSDQIFIILQSNMRHTGVVRFFAGSILYIHASIVFFSDPKIPEK